MKVQNYILQLLPILTVLLFFSGCGGERVNIKFKTSEQFFIDDSQTDTDKLNRELEYDIQQAEKKRIEKLQKEEAAKTEAEKSSPE
ncbi:MAG: hypothetical protein E3K37_09820 [Candidatus Kuenenia sp.]|nr:hypothetical protein [Candidatus Kuenenia hertensis]